MPKNSESYISKESPLMRNGKTGGLKGKPDVGRSLGKSFPAGKETRGIKDQSGSIGSKKK